MFSVAVVVWAWLGVQQQPFGMHVVIRTRAIYARKQGQFRLSSTTTRYSTAAPKQLSICPVDNKSSIEVVHRTAMV